jgi:phosphoglycerol transferase MdoB-like AlkP superfamily enzyme
MATGTRTTRGVEALLHGVPPLPGIPLNQREGFSRLPSLPRALKAAGFDTVFVYGGWPGFSNFKNYWSGIGFDSVLTRDNFDNKWFETSWGVADEILFERVLREMDARTARSERVFLSTLTVTNHRPYDFPAGRVAYPADQRKQEFAVAYADWALGQFLEAAEKKPWFKDTLIVVVPDHAPNPKGDTLIPVEGYRLPGIMLIPGVAPTVREGVGSLMDLPTTIMHQLCLPPVEEFMGRNLLADNISGVAPVEFDYMLGLYDGDSLTVLRRNQSILAWRKNGNGEFEATIPDDERSNLTVALFRSAYDQYLAAPAASLIATDR